MGLDMYLRVEKYVPRVDWIKKEKLEKADNADFGIITSLFGMEDHIDTDGFGGIHVSFPVGYWRKANAIHRWFVDNVQNGEDDCRPYYVTREQLIELDTLCADVLADNTRAEELLHAQPGFFFGSYDYDEWYFGSLAETREIIKRALAIPEYMGDFQYQSSW